MKKVFMIIMCIVLLFVLSSCGNTETPASGTSSSNNSTYSSEIKNDSSAIDENSTEPIESSEMVEESQPEPVETYRLGDTVTTDILEFTLDYAELAIALHSGSAGDWDDILTPKEYDAEKDTDAIYVASLGHTLVSIQFSAKNLNRVDLQIADSYDDSFLTVKYKETDYKWDCHTKIIPSQNGYDWDSVVNSAIVKPQQDMLFRTSSDIAVEVEKLTDSFMITFMLPTSSGKSQEYTYLITEQDIAAYKNREIPIEEAVSHFRYDKAQEYFKKHVLEYKKLNTDEISGLITTEGVKMLLRMQNKSVDKKGNTFKATGDETGFITYYYKTTEVTLGYVISDNHLIIIMNSGNYYCSIYEIDENTYLLMNEGEVFGIILGEKQ